MIRELGGIYSVNWISVYVDLIRCNYNYHIFTWVINIFVSLFFATPILPQQNLELASLPLLFKLLSTIYALCFFMLRTYPTLRVYR